MNLLFALSLALHLATESPAILAVPVTMLSGEDCLEDFLDGSNTSNTFVPIPISNVTIPTACVDPSAPVLVLTIEFDQIVRTVHTVEPLTLHVLVIVHMTETDQTAEMIPD